MDEEATQEKSLEVYSVPQIADTLIDVIYYTTKQPPRHPRFDQDPDVRRAKGTNYIYEQVRNAMRLSRKKDKPIWVTHPQVGNDLHGYNEKQMEHILKTLLNQMSSKKILAKNLQRSGLNESVISQARARLLHQEETIPGQENLQENQFLQPKEPTAA